MTMRTRTDVLLLAGFCAFLFFYGLGQFGLIGADEPRYAQVAREMLDRHDWVTPTLAGQPWLEKPPLYYWEAILSYSVFGVSDVAARIPSAFDATLLVIAVYLFFRKFRQKLEVDAALITASCAAIIGFSRAASTDMPLASMFSISMLAWWAWRESNRRIYLALFYAFMGFGMLAKGPVAPFLGGLVIVVFAFAVRDWRLIVKTLWIPGILVFCFVSLPWYSAVQTRNPQFFREFILEHNLARFSTNLYHHPEPFWYYLPVIALCLVPWLIFVILALVESIRLWWSERNQPSSALDLDLQFRVFGCCWLILPVIFFSLSRSKLPGYILPAVTAGAILLVAYLRDHMQIEHQSVQGWIAILHALISCAPIVPAMLVGYLVEQHRLPTGQPLYIAGGVAVVIAIAVAATIVNRLRMLRFVTLIPVVLAVAAVLKMGTAALDQKLSARPLAVELAAVDTHALPTAVFGVSREVEYGLAFYRNQAIVRYESGNIPAGEHLLVAPTTWMDNVAKATAGRRVSLLGHYAPQHLDYYWVAVSQR